MESMAVNPDFWRGKRVFITGHTGFKGGWLALWLQAMGAELHGYALDPPTTNNLFTAARVSEAMASSVIADIRDVDNLHSALQATQPEIVFHLAAQSLVRYSYAEPLETYEVNVMGTVNLYEAVRATPSVQAIVNVTSDKCYENREWNWGYRENEAMGGADPYSSSKGCVELVTTAYRQSFFGDSGVALASARAGNVIGGGDWAKDRLIPDIFLAMDRGETLKIRSPNSTRPWQHVLEPLSGYLLLAERLCIDGTDYANPWNFGPAEEDSKSVAWLVEGIADICTGLIWEYDKTVQPHEANFLKLDSSKAHSQLGWWPRWRIQTALEKTVEWREAWRSSADMRSVTISQIQIYQSDECRL